MPAPTPHRHLALLAEFLASQQVFRGSSQVPLFEGQLSQSPIQFGCFRWQGLALVHHDLQQSCQCVDSSAQTTQRRPDVGQDGHGADRDQGCCQRRAVSGCSRQTTRSVASRSPLAQYVIAMSAIACCAPEVVSFRQELEYPLSVLHGAGHITHRMGAVGTGHADGRQQRPKLFFVRERPAAGPARAPASARRPSAGPRRHPIRRVPNIA